MIYNTLRVTGAFDRFKQWLIVQATADIRVQTILLAWASASCSKGWSASATHGPSSLRSVSFGALGAPIIGLSKVTGLKLYALSAAVGKIVAILALLPPWVLLFLVSGKGGIRTGWPLAVVGSLAYIAGQFPISQFAGPYLPDIVGSLTSFFAILVLLRFWQPKETLGFGGVPIETPERGGGRRPSRPGRSWAGSPWPCRVRTRRRTPSSGRSRPPSGSSFTPRR